MFPVRARGLQPVGFLESLGNFFGPFHPTYPKMKIEHKIVATLKNLSTLDEVWDYCERSFVYLGEGNSRAAFAVSNSTVIKIVTDDVQPNRTEWRVGSNPANGRFVPRVLDHHPEFWWILVERLKAVLPEEAFRIVGVSERALGEFLDGRDWYETVGEFDITPEQKSFIEDLKVFVRANRLDTHSLETHQEWGWTHDGRFVLMDFE